MEFDKNAIKEKLDAALAGSVEFSEEERANVVFHMTDWLDELARLTDVFWSPSGFSDEEVYSTLLKFLIHAPEHIAAAAHLMTGYSVDDIFADDRMDK